MRFFNMSNLILALTLALPVLILAAACGASAPPDSISPDVTITGTIADSGEAPGVAALPVSFTNDRMAPETIRVKQGDQVTLNLDSDRPGSFHIHGYDLEQEVAVGEVTPFRFVADATGRFRINFHGSPAAAAPDTSSPASGGGSNYDGPVESAVPLSIDIATQVEDNGGLHVSIDTEGWNWAPDEVNEAYLEGAGHAHIYVDGKKIGRIYGPYYYLPSLEPGAHEVLVDLTTNAHNTLTWQGRPVEATTTVTVPDEGSTGQPDTGPEPEPVVSEAPMSLEVVAHEDALGGYNVQVIPSGFRFSQSVGLKHKPGEGYAQLSINGEVFNRLYVPWLQVPAQGEGEHTFTVALLNNEGQPYLYNGQSVAMSVMVHEAAKSEDGDGAMAGHHQNGDSDGSGHHHGSDSDAGATEELEVGYLEVLP